MKRWEKLVQEIEMPAAGQKVFIWGAGNTAVLSHQGMVREKLYEEFGVVGFLDSKPAGTKFLGFPVYHYSVLDEEDPKEVFILICTTNHRVFNEIEKICNEKGFKNCLLDAAILKIRQEQFHQACTCFDAVSQNIYCSILSNRALVEFPQESLYAGESYFGIPEFCRCSYDDVIIDCGAYVGDSAERYLWRMDKFKKYIAIEPDYHNYKAMKKRFERLNEEWNFPEGKLISLNAGLDRETKKLAVETRVNGLGSIALDKSGQEIDGVQFWALDDLIKDRFTFLKADIESFEYRMLCGARESIQKYHPRMAICIYHNMVDMFSIPLLIHEIEPSYHLSVRHHSYGYEETVLYAY